MERTGRFHSFIRWLTLFLGVVELEKAIVNISADIKRLESKPLDAIIALEEVQSLARVAKGMQNRVALGMLFTAQGGIDTVVSTSGCVHVDQSGGIETNAKLK